MANFLRDRHIKHLSVNKDRIKELYNIFLSHGSVLIANGLPVADVEVRCMIRFDEKGYIVRQLDDLFVHYDQALKVERLIITIETRESLDTSRRFGSYAELTMDKNLVPYLVVSSDDRTWTEGAYSAIQEALIKSKAWYGFARTVSTELLIQIVGVVGMFLLSAVAARRLEPALAIETPFLIAFLFAFVLSANIWGYLQRQVHGTIQAFFPNVQFVKSGRESLHWVVQAFVAGFIGILMTAILGAAWAAFTGFTGVLFR